MHEREFLTHYNHFSLTFLSQNHVFSSHDARSTSEGFEKVLNAHLNTIAATFEDVWQFVTLANVRLCLRVCVHTCVLSN